MIRSPLILVAIILVLAMTIAWAIQRLSGKSGWIDTIWSLAVGAGGILVCLLGDGSFERRSLLAVMIAAWSLRLGLHIGSRTRIGGEDPRYQKFIDAWGDKASLRLFVFLQVQAIAAFVLVLAVHLAASNVSSTLRPADIVAALVVIMAIGGEALADSQLSHFRSKPEARTSVCEEGLWRYSRHPNYFFEWLYWCAWPLLAITGSPFTWLSLLAPLQMYWLLVHVSGIPPLEEHMLASRGDAFRALQGRVNAFFPGPRKQGNHP